MPIRDIQGFEGRYAITDDGQIFNYNGCRRLKIKGGFWMKIRSSGKSGLKKKKRDYKTIALWKNGKYIYYYIHRLVAQTFIPNPLNLPEINHKNGIKSDNHIKNLEWCSKKYNSIHAFKNGFTTRGEKNSQTKLTKEQVLEIREKYSQGNTSHYKLAKEYNVSPANIGLIVRRKNWFYI